VGERCRALGIGTALCLMREGRVLKQLLDARGGTLDARELYISRFVALKAAILDGTEDELVRFVARPSPPRLSKLLAQLGLDAHALHGTDPSRRVAPHEAVPLVRRILSDRGLRERVVRESAEVRARLLRHLDSAGALSGTLAVVDLGYSATIQECLEKILVC